MKLGEAFPSKYISAGDLPDEGLAVTIDSYDLQDVGQGEKKQEKPVLYFRERNIKPMVLNKTNAKTIEKITGSDDLDNWIGHKITLVPREVEFQGEPVWSVRVQLPRQQANRAATAAQAPVSRATSPSTSQRGGAGGPDAPPIPVEDLVPPDENVYADDVGF